MFTNSLRRFSFICLLLGTRLAPAADGYRTRGEAELFVDDGILATTENVERVWHRADKLERPVLEPAMPWEGERIYLYGTVHHDAASGRFRMWYNAAGICYAESADGLHWVRPKLGLHAHNGSTENNIVLPEVINLTVFVDEAAADPAEKYKALFGSGRFYRGGHSADGIHWKMYHDGGKLIPFGSELAALNRDPVTGEYLAFIRTHPPKLHPQSLEEKRTCALTTSRDFRQWSDPVVAIEPDAIDDRWTLGADQRTEFYGWNGFKYGSQYLGFLTVFRIVGTIAERAKPQSAFDGPIDVQLIHSRDGRAWSRTRVRTPVVTNGPHAYDAGTILHIANNPIVVGDEVWLYYTAINTTHGGPMPPKRCTIALAKWRLDGFASLRAHWGPGLVQTVPMTAAGGAFTIEVNADATRGRLAVEVLGADGRALPGFAVADCRAITTDSVRHRIAWTGGDRLAARGPFALRFHLTNADLYSFRVVPAR
jgi:hypothetical protein